LDEDLHIFKPMMRVYSLETQFSSLNLRVSLPPAIPSSSGGARINQPDRPIVISGFVDLAHRLTLRRGMAFDDQLSFPQRQGVCLDCVGVVS
jgi:hypothetical protein